MGRPGHNRYSISLSLDGTIAVYCSGEVFYSGPITGNLNALNVSTGKSSLIGMNASRPVLSSSGKLVAYSDQTIQSFQELRILKVSLP